MTLPTIFLGIVISTLFGVLFHLWRGGSLTRLLYYILLGWAGFWIGNWIAGYLGWTFLNLGQLHLGVASLTSILVILIGYWLSLAPKKL